MCFLREKDTILGMGGEMQIDKTALVLQGGGTRGAFTSGVLDVFMENGLRFSYVIGTSAGALNGFNYVSGDIGRGKKVCTEILFDPKFCSFRNRIFRGGAFNFTYLFHTLPQTTLPFNSAAYNASTCRFFCVATSLSTGQVTYFQKGVCNEFYKALAASSSLPLISKPVTVLGEKYLDGGVVCPVPYQKPLDDGFEKLVMVMTRPRGYRRRKMSLKLRFAGWLFYHRKREFMKSYRITNSFYDQAYIDAERLENEGKALVIYPPEHIHVGRIEKRAENIEALYQAGRECALARLDEIKAYVEEKHE